MNRISGLTKKDICYYVLAFFAVVAAAIIRYVLGPTLGAMIPVVIFTLPVVISAFYGGCGPAIVATLFSALLSTYLFIPPHYGLAIDHASGVVSISVFVVIGFVISLFGRKLKISQRDVLQKSEQLKQTAERLQEEDRRKNEFLAMLAHELRNPLAGISAAADVMKLVKLNEERLAETNEVIRRQVSHMTQLINDLLDVSRVTRGLIVINKGPVDVRNVVSGAIEQARPLINEKGQQLTLQVPESPIWIEGDQTRLIQATTNVLSNAAKYTPQGGHIRLRVDIDSQYVELSVQDNGSGLEAELLPYIFDPFVQAKRTPDRSQGGLGLGLALVKNILTLHGGNVKAVSEGLGKGSKFILQLPRLIRTEEPPEQAQSRSTAPVHGHSQRILIVDDNRDAAQNLASILQAHGHTVSVAYNAKQALDRIHTDTPDVFVLDIGMPDMDGYELARRLLSMPNISDAVFIAITGYGQPEDKEKAKAAGFDHHFTKPVDSTKLTVLLAGIDIKE